MKFIRSDDHDWHFHTSLRAQSSRLLWPLQQELRESKVERSTAGGSVSVQRKQWLTVVRLNREPSPNISTTKESQAALRFYGLLQLLLSAAASVI
ncbi:Hypothetical protein SMAX5B_022146 [Scophthalmus maximus]|uniref:Uncharacterized protein n=1 Tax=Scophthalmus maximus TaxID=52904 RepID=A0A2U9B790_SCOMX|nr:Hypothetical protein SMAX5B_022146 [Scophthalmus maximus]